MKDLQTHLSDKMKFAIHMKRPEEVERYYRVYIEYTNLKGINKNLKLLIETNTIYANYQVKLAKEELEK